MGSAREWTYALWRAIILPVCCYPSGGSAGIGLDALTARRRRRWWMLLLGSTLWTFMVYRDRPVVRNCGSGSRRELVFLPRPRTLARAPRRLPDHMGEAMACTSANQSNPPGPAIRGIAIKRPGRYLLKKKHFCLTTGRNRSQPHSEPAINSLPLKSSLKPYVLKILWRFTQGGSAPN